MPADSAHTMEPAVQPVAPVTTSGGDDAVLKLKGLPYSTTHQQVREFFQDYKVKTVEFVSEPDGRPSGLGFVEFESKEEALKALSRNGEYIGERYVRLLHVPKSEMEEQVRLGTLAVPGAAAKMRNRLLRGQQQARITGYLAPQLLMPTALVSPPGGHPGGRPIMALQPHQPGGLLAPYTAGPGPGAPPPQMAMDSRIWGGYHPAATMQLHQQFAGLGLGPAQPTQQLRGPAGGGAFSLLSPHHPSANQQAVASTTAVPAMPTTGSSGGPIGQAGPPNGAPGGANVLHFASGTATMQSSSSGTASHRTSSAGQLPDMSGGGAAAALHAARMSGGGPTPTHLAGLTAHHLAAGAAPGGGFHGHGMNGGLLGDGSLMQLPHYAIQGHAGMMGGNAAGSHLLGGQLGSGEVGGEDAPPASATVKMRGLPYRSSPAEILGFFTGFQYLPDSLQIGLDAAGRPSGEAWLTFDSPSEAGRAVKALNRRYLGARYLELSCCSG